MEGGRSRVSEGARERGREKKKPISSQWPSRRSASLIGGCRSAISHTMRRKGCFQIDWSRAQNIRSYVWYGGQERAHTRRC